MNAFHHKNIFIFNFIAIDMFTVYFLHDVHVRTVKRTYMYRTMSWEEK